MYQEYLIETHLPNKTKYSIEIEEGICYFCCKKFKNIKNYTLQTDYTINICDSCHSKQNLKLITNINQIDNYYTKYKLSWNKSIHYITINTFRNIGYQDYNKLIE